MTMRALIKLVQLVGCSLLWKCGLLTAISPWTQMSACSQQLALQTSFPTCCRRAVICWLLPWNPEITGRLQAPLCCSHAESTHTHCTEGRKGSLRTSQNKNKGDQFSPITVISKLPLISSAIKQGAWDAAAHLRGDSPISKPRLLLCPRHINCIYLLLHTKEKRAALDFSTCPLSLCFWKNLLQG